MDDVRKISQAILQMSEWERRRLCNLAVLEAVESGKHTLSAAAYRALREFLRSVADPDELARFREENERLREALERIDGVDRDAHNLRDAANGLSATGKIARAALKGSDT